MDKKIPKPITEIQRDAHNQVLDYRNLEYLVCSRKFATAYSMSTEEQKFDILKILDTYKFSLIKEWVNGILRHELSAKNVDELRKIASRLGITGANYINKTGLLSIIKKESENEKT